MKNDQVTYSFLASFFSLFGAYINEYKIIADEVIGNILWEDNDEEKQDFIWIVNLKENVLIELKLLCDFLLRNNLVNGDNIIISENDLELKLSELGWSINDAKNNIDNLCLVEVKMIDNGEETDSFFLHF